MKIQSMQATTFEGKKIGSLSVAGYRNLKELLTKMNNASTYPTQGSFENAKVIMAVLPKGKGNGGFSDYRFLKTNTPENQMIKNTAYNYFIPRRNKEQLVDLTINNETGEVTKNYMTFSEKMSNVFKLFTGNYRPVSNKSIIANLENDLVDSVQNFDSIEKTTVTTKEVLIYEQIFSIINGIEKVLENMDKHLKHVLM